MRVDPLGPDYRYFVADQCGQTHDIGALVTALLSIRLHHPTHVTTDISLTAAEQHLARASAEAGIESGIMLAVHKLFGPGAANAFRAHCDALTHTARQAYRVRGNH